MPPKHGCNTPHKENHWNAGWGRAKGQNEHRWAKKTRETSVLLIPYHNLSVVLIVLLLTAGHLLSLRGTIETDLLLCRAGFLVETRSSQQMWIKTSSDRKRLRNIPEAGRKVLMIQKESPRLEVAWKNSWLMQFSYESFDLMSPVAAPWNGAWISIANI